MKRMLDGLESVGDVDKNNPFEYILNKAWFWHHDEHVRRMALATVVQGVGSGFVGIFVAKLIENVQILGFGSDTGGFLHIAESAPGWRRLTSVCIGGVFGAVSWYWLRGREPRFVSVHDSMEHGTKMPPFVTLINAIIQDVCVALGGSFGREAAPREIAAMWGGIVGDSLEVTPKQRRVLVACGTGAGLAAVYSVPISGCLYTIEHILNWDMSLDSVIPAITTSVIATIVTCTTVPTHGLYDVPHFGYAWPSWQLCLWAAFIGPIAGVAAAQFCKLVAAARKFRPVGRLPVHFHEAPVGLCVRLLLPATDADSGSQPKRVRVMVTERTSRSIVAIVEGGHEMVLTQNDWDEACPEGRRDWSILVGMPAAFLALALLSADFPSLLGNGRALAIVSLQLRRPEQVLAMLFFLKAFVTAAAIGSGADGGTLTPSVSLGATLGIVVGSLCMHALPFFGLASGMSEAASMLGIAEKVEETLAIMAIVAAAGFLAAAMKSPATGLWLIVEFSAQGVRREDLAKLLRLDPSGIIASKLAIGVLLPCSICVFFAMGSFGWASQIKCQQVAVPSEPEPCTAHPQHSDSDREMRSVHSMPPAAGASSSLADLPTPSSGSAASSAWRSDDIDIGHDFGQEGQEVSNHVRSEGFFCFRQGLLLNTLITVCFASALPRPPAVTTLISGCGVCVAASLSVARWRRRSLSRGTFGDADVSQLHEPMLHVGRGWGGVGGTTVWMSSISHYRLEIYSAFCGASGAFVPLVPWILEMYAENSEFTVICSSAAAAVAAAAFMAVQDAKVPYGTIVEQPNTGKRPRAVARLALITAIVGLLPLGLGVFFGRVSMVSPINRLRPM
eukprot:TRINITY_DN40831_c0_g1_i1.p1 TRINITY_DN40831_c0_g1~~TRINITY_DN40831_c0_g1_i1.p1  ORF type:complete len:844 (+),score=134.99 TRINITY_DN40831_c0_g1_i1:127-2658(+)